MSEPPEDDDIEVVTTRFGALATDFALRVYFLLYFCLFWSWHPDQRWSGVVAILASISLARFGLLVIMRDEDELKEVEKGALKRFLLISGFYALLWLIHE